MDMYSLLYLKWITNKDIQYSTWNSVQGYMAAWIGGNLRGECTHEYVWLNPFTVHCWPETITTLLTGYTPIQNKVLKNEKKKKERELSKIYSILSWLLNTIWPFHNQSRLLIWLTIVGLGIIPSGMRYEFHWLLQKMSLTAL